MAVTLYFILILVGLTAIAAVAILYFIQRKSSVRTTRVHEPPSTNNGEMEIDTAWDERNIERTLAIYRGNQPVFLKVAEDMLFKVRSSSAMTVVRQQVREYEVAAELVDKKEQLLKKMESYNDAQHSYGNQPIRHKREDEIAAVRHEHEVTRLKSETDQLKNPPPPPKERQPLTSSEIARLKEEERERQLEEARLVLEHEVRYRQMRDDILGAYEEEQRKKHTRQLDLIKNELAERRADIQADSTLSPLEKENHLRALQKEYMRQLDEFEAKL